MRHLYTFLAATLVILSSCSSSRKASQTPDDVYYSPGTGRAAAAAGVDPNADEYTAPAARGDYYSTAPSDNYVRLKTQDQARWSYFDDYNGYDSYYAPADISPYYAGSYGYTGYGYGLGFGFGSGFALGFGDPYSCWNSYFLWNSWYNPYFYNPYYGGGVLYASHTAASSVYSHLRTFNGATYREGMTTRVTNSNNRAYRPVSSSYYTPPTRSGTGRYVTTSSNGNYRPAADNNGNYRPSSNYTPASNSGSYRPAASSSQPVRSYTPAASSSGGGFSRPGRH